jgi:hypothetical protein
MKVVELDLWVNVFLSVGRRENLNGENDRFAFWISAGRSSFTPVFLWQDKDVWTGQKDSRRCRSVRVQVPVTGQFVRKAIHRESLPGHESLDIAGW